MNKGQNDRTQVWPSPSYVKEEGTGDVNNLAADVEQPDWDSTLAQQSNSTNLDFLPFPHHDVQQIDDAQATSLEITSESNSNKSMVNSNSLNSCFSTKDCSFSCEPRLEMNSKEESAPFQTSICELESNVIQHDDGLT